jgi:bacillithiol biosynthesis deacetylase BshB1
MKLDILAIGVHPDDVELSCCGTLLHHIKMGKKVGLLDLTEGELGTRGSAEIRLQEAEAASRMMGATVRVNLGMEDGFFEYNQENLVEIIEILRLFKPDIVLTNAIDDRHPDHGRAAKLTADACFLSGLVKIKTEWEGEDQLPWRPKAIYHYIQDYYIEPDFVLDITPYVDEKIDIIQCYKSQFFDPNSKEKETPISTKSFLDLITSKAQMIGRPAGFEYAEGFTKSRTVGVKSLYDIV